MMLKYKYLKIIITLLFILSGFVFSDIAYFAAGAEIPVGKDIKSNLENTAGQAGLKPEGETQNNYAVIGSIINNLMNLLGLLFLILMIYGGVMWMTAQGNEDRIAKAKKIIINAVIGLSIVLLAKAITYVILEMSRPAVEGVPEDISTEEEGTI